MTKEKSDSISSQETSSERSASFLPLELLNTRTEIGRKEWTGDGYLALSSDTYGPGTKENRAILRAVRVIFGMPDAASSSS